MSARLVKYVEFYYTIIFNCKAGGGGGGGGGVLYYIVRLSLMHVCPEICFCINFNLSLDRIFKAFAICGVVFVRTVDFLGRK